jgi:hypothetical protein
VLLLTAACSDTSITTEPQFEPFARRDLSGCAPETPTGCVTVNDGAPAETRYTLVNVLSRSEGDTGLHLIDGSGRLVNYWGPTERMENLFPNRGH